MRGKGVQKKVDNTQQEKTKKEPNQGKKTNGVTRGGRGTSQGGGRQWKNKKNPILEKKMMRVEDAL